MDVGRIFKSHAIFEQDLATYSKATFQTFTTLRSKKYSDNEKERKTIVFSELVLKCVHMGQHNWRGRGQRSVQHTRQIACPVYLRLAGSKKSGWLIIKDAPDEAGHNHELSELNWSNERENRLLTGTVDQQIAKDLIKNNVPVRAMAKAILATTKKPIRNKDIHNFRKRHEDLQKKGDTESENLREYLRELEQKNADTYIFVDKLGATTTQIILLVTEDMKLTYRNFPEILFLDATYKVNRENYAMYVYIVQDGNGLAQVVGVAWIASEKEATVRRMMQEFQRGHGCVTGQTEVIMVDKDFVEIKVCEEVFPNARVLLCIFHVLKAVKNRISKEDQPVAIKQAVLTVFRRCLYSQTQDAFDERWAELTAVTEDDMPVLLEYFNQNWLPDINRWVMFTRRSLRTLLNTTNNRIERFNLEYKLVLKERRRTAPPITDCIRVFMDLMDTKANTATYVEFLQATTHLHIYDKEFQDFFDEVGQHLTDFASRLVRKEMKRYVRQRENMEVRNWGDNLYAVHNGLYGTEYQVVIDKDGGCECTFSASLAIACRHVIAVRATLTQRSVATLFNDFDYHSRWKRTGIDSREPFAIYRQFLDQVLNEDGELDEDDTTDPSDSERHDERPPNRAQRYAEVRKQTKLLDAYITDRTTDFRELLDTLTAFTNDVLAGKLPRTMSVDKVIILDDSENVDIQHVSPPSDQPMVTIYAQVPDIVISQDIRRRGRPTKASKNFDFNVVRSQKSAKKLTATDDELAIVPPPIAQGRPLSKVVRAEDQPGGVRNDQTVQCDCGLSEHSYTPHWPPPPIEEVEVLEGRTNIPFPFKNLEAAVPEKSWIKDLELGDRERYLIVSRGLVNAYHITAAMYLLRRQIARSNLEVVGGMDYQQKLQTDVTQGHFLTGRTAIQVVHVPGHWQLLIRQGEIVDFYCSLGREMSAEVQRVLGHLMRKKEGDKIVVQYCKNQEQVGVECGLHVIAKATAHVYGQDPQNTTYDADQMRGHLLECFEKKELSIFPPATSSQVVLWTKRVNRKEIVVPRLWHGKLYVERPIIATAPPLTRARRTKQQPSLPSVVSPLVPTGPSPIRPRRTKRLPLPGSVVPPVFSVQSLSVQPPTKRRRTKK